MRCKCSLTSLTKYNSCNNSLLAMTSHIKTHSTSWNTTLTLWFLICRSTWQSQSTTLSVSWIWLRRWISWATSSVNCSKSWKKSNRITTVCLILYQLKGKLKLWQVLTAAKYLRIYPIGLKSCLKIQNLNYFKVRSIWLWSIIMTRKIIQHIIDF